jgi:hypothetical protein
LENIAYGVVLWLEPANIFLPATMTVYEPQADLKVRLYVRFGGPTCGERDAVRFAKAAFARGRSEMYGVAQPGE